MLVPLLSELADEPLLRLWPQRLLVMCLCWNIGVWYDTGDGLGNVWVRVWLRVDAKDEVRLHRFLVKS